MKKKVIGIDLGTTFSSIGHVSESGVVEVIPNCDGNLKTKSVFSCANGQQLVGESASPDFVLSPRFAVRCSKRSMGKRSQNGKPIPLTLDVAGREVTPVDVAAAILAYLKNCAEEYLGCEVKAAVITVPAYFDEMARQDTVAAGRIAAFEDIKILNEPEAAAIYYELEKASHETVVVVDLGGGTTDVTCVEIKDRSVEVKATDGDAELGGANYDEAVLGLLREEAEANNMEISAEKDFATFNQMLDRAREAKEMLSRRPETTVIIESDGKRIPLKLTQDLILQASKTLNERFVDCCQRLSEQIQAEGINIDKVLLVGGSSRMFRVPQMVKESFGVEPSKDTDPDLVVTKGAAIWAEVCFGDKSKAISLGGRCYLAGQIGMRSVAAHAICVAARRDKDDPTEYNCVIVPANTELPCDFEKRFAPVYPGSTSVVVKLVQGKPGLPSENSILIRKIDVPIHPSDNDQDRIKVHGKYTDEGLIEITIVDELLSKPVSESFVHKSGLSEAEIVEKRMER
jgi:molecular chaperone DnaK